MFWFKRRKAIPRSVRQAAFDEAGNECAFCHDNRVAFLSVDHIWPVILGGTNDLDNLRVLCRTCNSEKGGFMSPGDALNAHPELHPGDLLYGDAISFSLNGSGSNAANDYRSQVYLRDDVVPVFVPQDMRDQVVEFVRQLREGQPARFPEVVRDGKAVSARPLMEKETPEMRAAELRRNPRPGRNPAIETTLAQRGGR